MVGTEHKEAVVLDRKIAVNQSFEILRKSAHDNTRHHRLTSIVRKAFALDGKTTFIKVSCQRYIGLLVLLPQGTYEVEVPTVCTR